MPSTARTKTLSLALAALLLQACQSSPALESRLREISGRSTINVAHRGDSGRFPENTLPAFESAVSSEAGADMVELDFYQTKDGVLVCFHDSTLDRTTDAITRWGGKKLRLPDYTYAELTELDAGAWKDGTFAGTRIPTLEAALRSIQPRSITMIERKHGDPAALVALLRRLDLMDAVLVQSFDWEFLRRVRALAPDLALGVLGGTKKQPHLTGEMLEQIDAIDPVLVHWSFKRLRPEDVSELHRRGYLVAVYTLDETTDYRSAIEIGVDAITTNQPARLRTLLSRAGGGE